MHLAPCPTYLPYLGRLSLVAYIILYFVLELAWGEWWRVWFFDGRKRERKEEVKVFNSIKIQNLLPFSYGSFLRRLCYPKTGRMLATKPTSIALLDEWGLIKNVLRVVRMLA
jgi:hypothetical protein